MNVVAYFSEMHSFHHVVLRRILTSLTLGLNIFVAKIFDAADGRLNMHTYLILSISGSRSKHPRKIPNACYSVETIGKHAHRIIESAGEEIASKIL